MHGDLNLLNGMRERDPLTSSLETKWHTNVQQYNYFRRGHYPLSTCLWGDKQVKLGDLNILLGREILGSQVNNFPSHYREEAILE